MFRFKRFCVMLCLLLLFPIQSRAEYSLSVSHGVMSVDRVNEMVEYGGRFFMICTPPELAGTIRGRRIIEWEPATGKETVLYKSGTNIFGLLACDSGLYFEKCNFWHSRTSIYHLGYGSRRAKKVLDQEYEPYSILGIDENGLLISCMGEERGKMDILCVGENGISVIQQAVTRANAITNGIIQFCYPSDPYYKQYHVASGIVSDTKWSRDYVILEECGDKAIGNVFDEDRKLLLDAYVLFDKTDLTQTRLTDTDIIPQYSRYTFVIQNNVLLVATKEPNQEDFCIKGYDLDSLECLFSENLDLRSYLFKIGDELYMECVIDGQSRVAKYDPHPVPVE